MSGSQPRNGQPCIYDRKFIHANATVGSDGLLDNMHTRPMSLSSADCPCPIASSWAFEAKDSSQDTDVVGSNSPFMGARSGFFLAHQAQSDSRWRLVSRGSLRPNVVGRRWRDRLLYRWKLKDWFYACVHMSTLRLLLVFSIVYLLIITVYALVYLAIDALDKGCELGLHGHFRSAFFFSLETHATIGYGTPKPMFNECTPMLFGLFTQVFAALIGDGLLISLLFARLSTGTKRAASFIFSDRAIIVEYQNEPYLLFQIFDKRRDALVEASIRAFCYVHHGFAGKQFPYSRALRLLHPNSEDGNVLLSFAPTLVVHKLTSSSPILAAAALGGFSMSGTDSVDVSQLEDALRKLDHLEIVVEVNGIEGTTTSQVQARWSFLLSEIDFDVSDGECETPDVTIQNGRAQIHRRAVSQWRNATHGVCGQLAHALAFHVPDADTNFR